jgi:tRNA (guanine6-N2)-methyltransferase
VSKQFFPYYAQTAPGAEEIAWLEIRWRLPGVKFGEYLFAKEQNGIVTFAYQGEIADLQKLETAEDLFIQAVSEPKLSRGRRDVNAIRDLIGKSESLGRAANLLMRFRKFSRPPSYRVVSRKFGRHEYPLKEVQKAAIQGMQARYPKWQPVAEGAQVELSVDLLGSHLLCGFKISDSQTKKRLKLEQSGPELIRPSLAAALVVLTEPTAEDIFLDVLCDNGRLLHTRRRFGPYRQLIGADIAEEPLELTQQNLSTRRQGRLPDNIALHLWEYDTLPLDEASVDKVATVLPDRQQVGGEAEMRDLYEGMFGEIARVLRPGGRAAILSREYDQVKETLRHLPALETQTGYSVKNGAHWGRIYIVKRLPEIL